MIRSLAIRWEVCVLLAIIMAALCGATLLAIGTVVLLVKPLACFS